jgi:hypothetical protein
VRREGDPVTRHRLTLRDLGDLADAELVTIAEAADLIGEHPRLVREWVRLGHVPYAIEAGVIVVPDVAVIRRERDTRHTKRRRGGRPRRSEAP